MEENKVRVNELSDKPSKLWQELSVKQKDIFKVLKTSDFRNYEQKKETNHTRFVLISDTHNKTDKLELPEGDVLLHAGDFTQRGIPSEVEHFNNFLGREKHKFKHVIVICGNHELTFEPGGCAYGKQYLSPSLHDIDPTKLKEKLTNCTYIEDESIEVCGFKIYGSPWQPEFGGWAYNLPRGEKCLEKWNMIPDDTDILMTHGPPLGYGDKTFSQKRAGCAELLATVQQRVKPMLHVFGHIHEAYGVWTDGTTTFVNASTCAFRNRIIQPPIIIDLPNKS